MLPSAVFPPGTERVHFHLWPRFHGTRILVTVSPFGAYDPAGPMGCVVGLQFHGGSASSETGYQSRFIHLPRGHKPQPDVLASLAMEHAQAQYREHGTPVQLNLFR